MKKFVLLCGLMLSVMHISATDFTYNELNYSTVSENTCEVVSVSQDLTSVEIPAEAICDGTAYKVVGVAAKAFDAAKSITTITFPATLEYLANGSFFKTTKLKNITCLATTPPDISGVRLPRESTRHQPLQCPKVASLPTKPIGFASPIL